MYVREGIGAVTPAPGPAKMPLASGGQLRVLDRFTSPAGLALRTFLARHRVSFECVDIDADPLARFVLGAAASDERSRRASLASDSPSCCSLMADGWRRPRASRWPARWDCRPGRPNRSMSSLEREAPGGQAGASARIE